MTVSTPSPGFVLMIERTEEERYRIYARRGRELTLLATTPDPAGVGVALVHLDDDAKQVGRRLEDEGAIGVLDGIDRRWIVNPFHRQEQR